jgi:hypothetical protein
MKDNFEYQVDRVYNFLLSDEGKLKGLTQLDAIAMFMCTRLSAIIYRFAHEDKYTSKVEVIRKNETYINRHNRKSRYTRYYLKEI